jgi:hypothetical protein
MEGPISFWGYKEQESNLILPEHDDDDEKKTVVEKLISKFPWDKDDVLLHQLWCFVLTY